MKAIVISIVTCVCLSFAACQAKKPEPAQPVQATQAVGRADTKQLEAASMVGYDGKAIRSQVDKVLNKKEEILKEGEEAAK